MLMCGPLSFGDNIQGTMHGQWHSEKFLAVEESINVYHSYLLISSHLAYQVCSVTETSSYKLRL